MVIDPTVESAKNTPMHGKMKSCECLCYLSSRGNPTPFTLRMIEAGNCVRERVRVCVCVRERVRVCVCVCERERKQERLGKGTRERGREREREGEREGGREEERGKDRERMKEREKEIQKET